VLGALAVAVHARVPVAVLSQMIYVRHEVHCYIARVAGMDWRRCLWT
jgi:hypothetical protein